MIRWGKMPWWFGAGLVVFVVGVPQRTLAQPARPMVAVFGLRDDGARLSRPVVKRLSKYLANGLVSSGRYQAVPDADLKSALSEQKAESYKECYDEACQIEVGKELAASKALSGTILKIGKRCIVTLTLVDLRKSAKEAAGRGRGGCTEDAVLSSVDKALNQLVGRSPANEPVVTDMLAPVRSPPPTEDYDALLRQAEEAERRARAAKERADRMRATRQKKLKAAWTKVSKIVTTQALNRQARIGALEAFLRDYPNDNPHLATARDCPGAHGKRLQMQNLSPTPLRFFSVGAKAPL